jgi:hypothetical protein
MGQMICGSLASRDMTFFSLPNIQNGFSVHPDLIKWVPEALSPGIWQREQKVDQSPPSNVQLKNKWSYTYTPPIGLYGVDNFIFHIYHIEDSLAVRDAL